jgi:hypothetical protein
MTTDDHLAPAEVAKLDRLVTHARTQADQALALAREGVPLVGIDTVVGGLVGMAKSMATYDLALTLAGLVGHLLRGEAETASLTAERDRLRGERDAARQVLATIREDPDWDPGAMVGLYDREVDRADRAEAERDAVIAGLRRRAGHGGRG